MTWMLSDIRRKVRQVTGRLSPDNLPNSVLDNYINNYYVYTFPSEVKLERQYSFWEFNTAANVQIKAFPDTTYTNIEPPFWLNGNKIDYYQDPALFYANNPEQYQAQSIGTGDGGTVLFTNTLSGVPIIDGSLVITDGTETLTDSNGLITGDLGGSGTINYTTGAISVTFASAPASGDDIMVRYLPYQVGTPTAVLYYNDQLTFAPIPDSAYHCKVRAYSIVTALSLSTDTPVMQEWGPAIAYGAARDIHSDYGEMERYAEVTALYKEQIDYILTRTAQSLMNERAQPSF